MLLATASLANWTRVTHHLLLLGIRQASIRIIDEINLLSRGLFVEHFVSVDFAHDCGVDGRKSWRREGYGTNHRTEGGREGGREGSPSHVDGNVGEGRRGQGCRSQPSRRAMDWQAGSRQRLRIVDDARQAPQKREWWWNGGIACEAGSKEEGGGSNTTKYIEMD